MRSLRSMLPATALLLIVSACVRQEVQPPAEARFRIVATSKEVMNAITIPAADVVWSAPGEPPASDEAWLTIERAALALAESGNLLLMEGRAVDDGEWARQATSLIDTAMLAVEGARARDVERILDAGDEIYTVCEGCHLEYMPQEPAG